MIPKAGKRYWVVVGCSLQVCRCVRPQVGFFGFPEFETRSGNKFTSSSYFDLDDLAGVSKRCELEASYWASKLSTIENYRLFRDRNHKVNYLLG
jgi:hypothetical protein